MVAFATPQDLATFLHTPVDTAAAQLALDLASGTIRAATGQKFDRVLGDSVTLDGGGTSSILLPQQPVTAVTSVSITDWGFFNYSYQVPALSWRLFAGRIRWVGAGGWSSGVGGWSRLVTVVYDHGYTVVPDDVRQVCLTLAADTFTNPENLDQERVDDYQYRRTGRQQAGRQLDDLAALVRRYRLNATSVPIS